MIRRPPRSTRFPYTPLSRSRVEGPGKPAEPAQHLGAPGLRDPLLHQLHGPVPRRDVDPGRRVRGLLTHAWLVLPRPTCQNSVDPWVNSLLTSRGDVGQGRVRASAAPAPTVAVARPATSVRSAAP